MPPLIALRSVSKSFGGAAALREVCLEIEAGEIHALCGENGAGKSTLIEILAGNHRADSGAIEFEGRPVAIRSPGEALDLGIAVIHQEFSLVEEMTVAENLSLGAEPRRGFLIDRGAMVRSARERIDRLGFDIPVSARVARLPTGQKQLVEIAKALGRNARVLILDEPTAALTRAEATRLFKVLAELRTQGIAIVYVSHHLDEVLAMADRVSVLRDGGLVGTWAINQIDARKLMTAMVGEAVEVHARAATSSISGIEAIRTEMLSGVVLQDVSIKLHRGEILGVTGLAGAGHEELAGILFGSVRPRRGRFFVGGARARYKHPRQAILDGVASVPADRRNDGLLSTLDIERNLTITRLASLSRGGWISGRSRRRLALGLAADFKLSYAKPWQPATTLSGGNQQKVILARWCATRPSVILLNDPTRGIDVKTRESIHRRIEEMAARGVAILLVTSDTHELRRLADRVVIFRKGRVVKEASASELDDKTILAGMMDDSD